MNLTQSRLERELFGTNQGIDNTFFSDGYRETAFFLDTDWNRILFSQNSSNSLNIYSYGDNINDFKFKTPRSIDVNDWAELYIADSYNGTINKLYYSQYTNTITATSNANFITNLVRPVDVDYYQGGTLGYRPDDIIVVADEGDNCLLIYDSDGNFINTLTGYYYNGIKQIIRPRKVAVFGYEEPYRIAFIDGETNQLIVVRLPESFSNWMGWLYTTAAPVKFDGPSYLNDVGVDGCYNILVPDRAKNVVHKYNIDGKYSCSFPGNSDFRTPLKVSNIPDNCPSSTQVWVDFTISSNWEPTNGLRRYLPGADLISIDYSNQGEYYRLRFVPTDDIIYKAEIIRKSDNAIIQTYNSFAYNALQKDLILNYNDLPTNNAEYKWKFSYLPRYNDYYGEYAVNWRIREFNFTHNILPPNISHFTQSPTPICQGSSGYVYAHLSEGTGDISYNWTVGALPSGASITPMGNKCRISYQYTASKQNEILGDAYHLICTASNSAGSDITKPFVYFDSNCGGCPTLAIDDGKGFINENPILISSLSNPDKFVADYYLLENNPVQNEKKEFELLIHEPDNEHTWLDKVELWEIKCKDYENIAVTDSGEIFNYVDVNKNYDMNINGNTAIADSLQMTDGKIYQFSQGDKLSIDLSAENFGNDELYLLSGGIVPPPKEVEVAKITTNTLAKKQLDPLYLRPNNSIAAKKLGKNIKRIEIEFLRDVKLDLLTFKKDLKTSKIDYLDITKAVHSNIDDVKELLIDKDNLTAEILPGEKILLSFKSKSSSDKKKRYALKTVGKYLSGDSDDGNNTIPLLLPDETKLHANFPNPFNPKTHIKFSLANKGHVSLKIFNSLGEEVKTLINDFKDAGNYEAVFDASKLPSGVYIYSLRVDGYTSSKKMLLLK